MEMDMDMVGMDIWWYGYRYPYPYGYGSPLRLVFLFFCQKNRFAIFLPFEETNRCFLGRMPIAS